MVRILEAPGRIPVILVLLAHGWGALSLLAFGLRADGWVLHPVAVLYMAGIVLFGAAWLFRGPPATERPLRLVLPPMLTLSLLHAWTATADLGGARYAPYDPSEPRDLLILLHVGIAALITGMAALYRWPELLRAGVLAQGIVLLLDPGLWAALVHGGWPVWSAFPSLILLPVLYGLGAAALGVSFPRRAGIGMGAGLAFGLVSLGWAAGRGALVFREPFEAALWGGLALAGWALIAPMPALAALAVLPRDAEEPPRFPWEAYALFLWFPTAIAADLLTPGGDGLPAAGSVQPWVDPDQVVPDAWWPTIYWAGALLTWIHRLAPLILLPSFIEGFRWIRTRRWRALWPVSPAGAAVLGGVALIGTALWPPAIGDPDDPLLFFSPLWVLMWMLFGLLGWVLAARGLEHAHGPWSRWFWRSAFLLFAGLWLGPVVWMIGALSGWGRGLTPGPSTIFAHRTAGALLLLYGVAGAAGLTAGFRAVWEWILQESPGRGKAFLRAGIAPALPLLLLGAFVGWMTTLPVLRTVPPAGAREVPPDIVIVVELGPPRGGRIRELLFGSGGGGGISVRYADTGETIPGITRWQDMELSFDPEFPLRPQAPVEVRIFRWGERPYRFRFTTGGSGSSPVPSLHDPLAFPR
jgi:hypothetical protein